MTPYLAPAPAPGTRRAADDLAAVREQWGDLLAAIENPPAAEWPPRECAGFLDQLAATQRTEADEMPPEPVFGRLPLVLREHPAPANLDALDTALAVERDLFDLADRIAAAVQRPTYHGRDERGRWRADPDDTTDPHRWRFAAPASPRSDPGSRAYGLHWAAVWVEGRALSEQQGDLFAPTPAPLLDEIATTARRARSRVERALGRDARTTLLGDPCPWCGGPLSARTEMEAGSSRTVITCSTGEGCRAPVPLDERRRRVWRGEDRVGLLVALDEQRRGAAA